MCILNLVQAFFFCVINALQFLYGNCFCFIFSCLPDRRKGKDNLFRCTYVLPDGITHTKGFVKDLVEAERYLNLEDEASAFSAKRDDSNRPEVIEKPEDRRTIDLSKNVRTTYAFKLVLCDTFNSIAAPLNRNLT